MFDLEPDAVEPVTPSPKKRKTRKSSDLGESFPVTPHTLKAYGLTPEKANLLSKHGRKVKTFIPLSLAASKDVLALGREPTSQEYGEILGRNVERMVPSTAQVIRLIHP